MTDCRLSLASRGAIICNGTAGHLGQTPAGSQLGHRGSQRVTDSQLTARAWAQQGHTGSILPGLSQVTGRPQPGHSVHQTSLIRTWRLSPLHEGRMSHTSVNIRLFSDVTEAEARGTGRSGASRRERGRNGEQGLARVSAGRVLGAPWRAPVMEEAGRLRTCHLCSSLRFLRGWQSGSPVVTASLVLPACLTGRRKDDSARKWLQSSRNDANLVSPTD